MFNTCPACHLRFEREQGYFVGAIYLNYAATAVIAMAGFYTLDYFIVLSLTTQLLLWGTFSLVFPLWAFRYSKSLWLSLDYFFDPHNAPEG